MGRRPAGPDSDAPASDAAAHRRPARLLLALALVFLTAHVALRLYPLVTLPPVADEPDDLEIILTDSDGIDAFFEIPGGYEFDQARLPHFSAGPLLFLFEEEGIVPLRLLYLAFHLVFLGLHFRLARLVTRSVSAAWIYLLLLTSSCYLASFSIFSMTTGDNLYLMFHATSLLVFASWVRSAGEVHEPVVFRNFLRFAAAMGFCIASKLFGVFLLFALFLFHFVEQGRLRLLVRAPSGARLLLPSLLFIAQIVLLNALDLAGLLKLGIALLASLAYLGWLFREIQLEERVAWRERALPLVPFWSATTLIAFALTLILSPVYMNLSNLVDIFGWQREWGTGIIVSRSHVYDMPLIVVMKLGFVSTLAVGVATGLLLHAASRSRARHPEAERSELARRSVLVLFAFVFVVHFAIISSTRFKVTWYPLAIFPFLLLIPTLLWDRAVTHGARPLRIVAACLVAVIVADNLVRYGRWFPYGHFDGAQYGREYVGWNRAGLVSFEIIPKLHDWLVAHRDASDSPTVVNCQLVYVPLYNDWSAELLGGYFEARGSRGFEFHTAGLESGGADDFLLVSPLYHPQLEARMEETGFERMTVLDLKGLEIISIWRPRPDARVAKGEHSQRGVEQKR